MQVMICTIPLQWIRGRLGGNMFSDKLYLIELFVL